MKSRKAVSKTVSMLIIVIVVAALGISLWEFLPKLEPSDLSFSLDFPNSIVGGQSAVATAMVTNSGGDATGVSAVIVSEAVSGSSSEVDVKQGSTTGVMITIAGKDVQDGTYTVTVFLQYSDFFGAHKTSSQGASIYLLPNVELSDVRFKPTILHPLGKSGIGTQDTTSVLFKVHSKSTSVLYNGLSAKATLTINVPGISIDPSSVQIGTLGPNGRTTDYSVQISTNNAPPGTYSLQISLYSKDNQLVAQQTEQFTVTASLI
jgi:hypothetical protein